MATDRIRPANYSGGQKLLHWVIAIIVLVQIPVGLYMVARGAATNFDGVTNELYTGHKTFGAIILLLVLVRIAVRLARGAPPPVASLTPFQRIASHSVHGLVYVLLVVVPLLGWAGVSAYPALGILGGHELFPILPVNQKLSETILKYHGIMGIILAGLIAIHIGAALFHRVILKDGVLARMLP